MQRFLAAVADRQLVCEQQLCAYSSFLKGRNGPGYQNRERWLIAANQRSVRHVEKVDSNVFAKAFVNFDPRAALSQAGIALLSFVKVNAAEAYGVEVVGRSRLREPTSTFDEVEKTLVGEEAYHTRILLGATHQFDVTPPATAFKPPLPLQLLIGALVHVPKGLFHPVLLGAEIAGVYAFNWMLTAVRRVFSGEPELRDSLEERLTEILVDEVGHIAFNRLHVGTRGLSVAATISRQICGSTTARMPEMRALGFDQSALLAMQRFDLSDLPEEVRQRAFFV